MPVGTEKLVPVADANAPMTIEPAAAVLIDAAAAVEPVPLDAEEAKVSAGEVDLTP